jgi:hypothetical protein
MNSGAVTALVAIVGLLFTIAALFGSWKVSRNTAATRIYRDLAEAWEKKAGEQASEITDLKERDAAKGQEIAALRNQLLVLQDVVTGRSALELLDNRTATILALVQQMSVQLGR